MFNSSNIKFLSICLLLVFNLTSHAQAPNLKIPHALYSQPIQNFDLTISVYITAEGKMVLDGKTSKLSELEEYLISKFQQYPSISKRYVNCLLYADKFCPYAKVDEFKEELKRLGLSKIIYAVKHKHSASVYSNIAGLTMPLETFDDKAHAWHAQKVGKSPPQFESVILKSESKSFSNYGSKPQIHYRKTIKKDNRGNHEISILDSGKLIFEKEEMEINSLQKSVVAALKMYKNQTSFSMNLDKDISYGDYIRCLGAILQGVYECRNDLALKIHDRTFERLGKRARSPIKQKYPLLLFDYSVVEKNYYSTN